MRSAFGVEHTEVSKGVPKGLVAAAGKYKPVVGGDQKIQYAAERLKAHTAGMTARRNPGEKANLFGHSTPMQEGNWARRSARGTLKRAGQKPQDKLKMPASYTTSRIKPR